MICEKCGQEVQEGNLFCTNCGAPMDQAAPPPPGPPPAPAEPPAGVPPPPPVAQAPPAAYPGPAPGVPPSPPRSRKGLWIALACVGAAVIAAVVLVLVLVVFAGDTGRARDLMKKGDIKMDALQEKGDEVGAALNDFIDSVDQIGSKADFEAAAEDIRDNLETITEELKSAESSYREILGLDGVEEYKEYAKAILALIENNFEIVRTIEEYLDYLGREYAAADAGQYVDVDEITDTTVVFFTEIQALGEESDELEAEALDVKRENNLE